MVPSSDLSQIPQHVPSWPSSDQISSNTKSLAGLEETAGTAWGRVDPKWPITATLTLPYIPLPQTQKLSRAQSGIFETQTLEMLFCSLLGKSVSHGWAVCTGWRCFEDFGPLKKLQSGCIVFFFFHFFGKYKNKDNPSNEIGYFCWSLMSTRISRLVNISEQEWDTRRLVPDIPINPNGIWCFVLISRRQRADRPNPCENV